MKSRTLLGSHLSQNQETTCRTLMRPHNFVAVEAIAIDTMKASSTVLVLLVQVFKLCVASFPLLLVYWHYYYHLRESTMAGKSSIQNLNVFTKSLEFFSDKPMTGFYRDGYCRTSPEDFGNHAVAGVVSDEFLRFSASRGNDLRSIPGMKGGCKWCLCTSRWKEALDAYRNGQVPEAAVPKVFLHATDRSALGKVTLDDLRKFAADAEEEAK